MKLNANRIVRSIRVPHKTHGTNGDMIKVKADLNHLIRCDL